MEAKIGKKVKFQCISLRDSFNPKVGWIFNNGSIKGYAKPEGFGSMSLVIGSAQLIHSGFYTCYGMKTHLGIIQMFLAQAELRVFGKSCNNHFKVFYYKPRGINISNAHIIMTKTYVAFHYNKILLTLNDAKAITFTNFGVPTTYIKLVIQSSKL